MSSRFGSAVGPVVPVQAPAALAALGDPRQQALGRLLQDVIGRQLPVQVLARLDEGGYLVRVAGQEARMQLPSGTQPGSTLPMTVVEALPHPTFQLSTADLAGGPLVQAHAMPRTAAAYAAAPGLAPEGDPALPTGARDDAHTTLSPTARALSGILAEVASAPPRQVAVSASVPLAAGGVLVPEQLARALDKAIQHSGLFYESHLAEWSAGKRSLEELAREPQMRLAAAQPAPAMDAAEPTHAGLVNLQLNVLEQGQLSWQGQLIPGQPMHWTIEKDPPRDHPAPGQAGADDTPWRSTLRLNFPHLGEVSASLSLAGGQLSIQLEAEDDTRHALLRAGAPALERALGAAGARLAALGIGKPPP